MNLFIFRGREEGERALEKIGFNKLKNKLCIESCIDDSRVELEGSQSEFLGESKVPLESIWNLVVAIKFAENYPHRFGSLLDIIGIGKIGDCCEERGAI